MLHVVLFEPEIIQNAGNIARLCVGFEANLHLIRPYGFILDKNNFDKDFVRASANHAQNLNLFQYDDFNDFLNKNNVNENNIYFYTRYGQKAPSDYKYENLKDNDIYLVFGKESTGIDHTILKQFPKTWIRIPTSINLRSMNIANTVSIGMYEVVRQNEYIDLLKYEPHKKFE